MRDMIGFDSFSSSDNRSHSSKFSPTISEEVDIGRPWLLPDKREVVSRLLEDGELVVVLFDEEVE